jgi:hypothetical protein
VQADATLAPYRHRHRPLAYQCQKPLQQHKAAFAPSQASAFLSFGDKSRRAHFDGGNGIRHRAYLGYNRHASPGSRQAHNIAGNDKPHRGRQRDVRNREAIGDAQPNTIPTLGRQAGKQGRPCLGIAPRIDSNCYVLAPQGAR